MPVAAYHRLPAYHTLEAHHMIAHDMIITLLALALFFSGRLMLDSTE